MIAARQSPSAMGAPIASTSATWWRRPRRRSTSIPTLGLSSYESARVKRRGEGVRAGGIAPPAQPRVSGSRRTPLEAWVEHPRRYLSWVRLVRMKFSCHHGRVDVLPAQIQAFDSQLAEVEVLCVKTLHLFDSAFNLSVCVALRDREGTRLSCRLHGFLDLARAMR